MKTLSSWLHQEISLRQALGYALGILFIQLVFAFFVSTLVNSTPIPWNNPLRGNISLSFISVFTGVVILEEVFFRLPLGFIRHANRTITEIIVLAVILSIISGLLHGGVFHLFTQGLFGFVYSILFLKAGGIRGHIGKAFMVVVGLHLSFDVLLITGSILGIVSL